MSFILANGEVNAAAGMGPMLLSMILLFVLMYFLMIRPQ